MRVKITLLVSVLSVIYFVNSTHQKIYIYFVNSQSEAQIKEEDCGKLTFGIKFSYGKRHYAMTSTTTRNLVKFTTT